jgi:hypothetical protein
MAIKAMLSEVSSHESENVWWQDAISSKVDLAFGEQLAGVFLHTKMA